MVKKISKFFAYAFFFLLALSFFSPKVSLYYLLEHTLDKYGVVINNEAVSDTGFGLNIQNADVNIKSISSATIQNIDVKIFAIYNNIELQNIKLSSVAASMVPINVQEVEITYSIFNPLNLRASANGDFGSAEINFDILEFALHVELLASKKMTSSYRSTLRNLKKSKEGVYVYDKIIKH